MASNYAQLAIDTDVLKSLVHTGAQPGMRLVNIGFHDQHFMFVHFRTEDVQKVEWEVLGERQLGFSDNIDWVALYTDDSLDLNGIHYARDLSWYRATYPEVEI